MEDHRILTTRRLSYSSLDLWSRCRLSWLGQYVIGTAEQPSVAMIFGSAVHGALEMGNKLWISTGTPPSPDVPAAVFNDLLLRYLEDRQEPSGPLTATLDDFWGGETLSNLASTGTMLVRQYFRNMAKNYVPLQSEAELTMDLSYLNLSFIDSFVGVVDLVSTGELIADYKTGTRSRPPSAMHLSLQPTAYAALLGKPVAVHFIELLRSRVPEIKIFETGRLQSDIDWFIQRFLEPKAREIDEALTRAHEELNLGNASDWSDKDIPELTKFFSPTPGFNCDWCAFRVPCGYQVPL